MSSDHLLVLNSEQVDELLPLERAVEAVDEAYRAHARGEARLFPFVRELLDGGSACGIKSGYWPGHNVLGLKLAGYWPANAAANLANHQAGVMLAEASSGRLLAVMDGNLITSRRTAAAAVVATRALAPPDPAALAVLGCGAQGSDNCVAMLAAFPSLATVRLWDRTPARADRLWSQLRASWRGAALSVHSTPVDAVARADVIVTTTASRAPLLGIADIAAGAHVNAMGADTAGKRELDPELVERCVLVVDDRDQSRQLGESQDPVVWRKPPAAIGEVLLGMRPGRQSPDDVTVFDSTGIGLQDVSAADLVYREAVRLGRGTLLPWTRI